MIWVITSSQHDYGAGVRCDHMGQWGVAYKPSIGLLILEEAHPSDPVQPIHHEKPWH